MESPELPQAGVHRWRLASIALLAGTFVSVINSNIVNVPMHDIASDLHVSIASASLLVTAYGLTFGALMPLGGWVGNRYGLRRVYCIGVSGIAVGALASIWAPNLPVLVVLRILQGASSAMVTPLVIAILSKLYPPAERPRALSGWAAANGLGQALGPPLGGILASAFSWRSVFVPGPVIAGLACLAALRFVPRDGEPEMTPLDWNGALSLTAGAFLFLSAFAAIPQFGVTSPGVMVLGLAGLAFLALFVRATRRARHPFVSPALPRDAAFLTGALGVTAGTFSLGTSALGVPLYLTRELHVSTLAAGFISVALPLALVSSAPYVSRRIRRTSAAAGLRIGLGALIAGGIGVGVVTQTRASTVALIVAIAVVGIGLAFVHTGSAVSSTATAVGRYGAGVGLFNTIRLTGSTLGAAWVGLVLKNAPAGYPEIFYASAAVAAAGLIATLLVRERTSAGAAAAEPSATP